MLPKQVSEINIQESAKLAFKNRSIIETEANCWCYHCVKSISRDQIREWTDSGETAICPLCSVDSILPGNLDKSLVQRIHDFWF